MDVPMMSQKCICVYYIWSLHEHSCHGNIDDYPTLRDCNLRLLKTNISISYSHFSVLLHESTFSLKHMIHLFVSNGFYGQCSRHSFQNYDQYKQGTVTTWCHAMQLYAIGTVCSLLEQPLKRDYSSYETTYPLHYDRYVKPGVPLMRDDLLYKTTNPL